MKGVTGYDEIDALWRHVEFLNGHGHGRQRRQAPAPCLGAQGACHYRADVDAEHIGALFGQRDADLPGTAAEIQYVSAWPHGSDADHRRRHGAEVGRSMLVPATDAT